MAEKKDGFKDLKNIAEIMHEYRLNHIKFENDSTKYELSREFHLDQQLPKSSGMVSEQLTMKSPLVGIFYRRSAQDATPFVEVGDSVQKGDTLCLIEATKMFTEVISDFDGTITEICVRDGSIIEFAQPLFKYVTESSGKRE